MELMDQPVDASSGRGFPEDWGLRPLCELGAISSGGTPNRSNASFWGGQIPWITTAQIDGGTILQADEFISDEGLRGSSAKKFPAGTILMAMYGQGKTRGKVAVLGLEATTNQACAAILLNKSVSGEYIFHYLASQYENIRGMSNSGGQENLSGGIVASIPIPLPPLAEQQAIATALNDVDALITALDQLIDKKRGIKQAAMQDLLTRRQRLPGFGGDWKKVQFSALGYTYGGLTGKTKVDFGQGEARYIPFMNVMAGVEIDATWLERVRVAPSERQNRVQKGDLFFNGSSETPEEVGLCSVLLYKVEDVFLNSFCFGFRLASGADVSGLFLAYFFRSDEGRKLIYSLAQGATRYNVSKTALLRLMIPLPSAVEQIQIAEVFSDMDNEIAALGARRDKIRAIKQGMMQELLTGRTRLV